jgi:hypothetical protein
MKSGHSTVVVPMIVDLPLLRRQKRVLIAMQPTVTPVQSEAIEGVLNLLDRVEDVAEGRFPLVRSKRASQIA